MEREYCIIRMARAKADEPEGKAEKEIVEKLNDLGRDGWRVIQDLNQEPHCHKFLLEREFIPSPR